MDHLKLTGDYTSLVESFASFFETTQSNLLNLSHTLILYTGRPIILNTTGRLQLIAVMDICAQKFFAYIQRDTRYSGTHISLF